MPLNDSETSKSSVSKLSLRKRRREKKRHQFSIQVGFAEKDNTNNSNTHSTQDGLIKSPKKKKRSRGQLPVPNFDDSIVTSSVRKQVYDVEEKKFEENEKENISNIMVAKKSNVIEKSSLQKNFVNGRSKSVKIKSYQFENSSKPENLVGDVSSNDCSGSKVENGTKSATPKVSKQSAQIKDDTPTINNLFKLSTISSTKRHFQIDSLVSSGNQSQEKDKIEERNQQAIEIPKFVTNEAIVNSDLQMSTKQSLESVELSSTLSEEKESDSNPKMKTKSNTSKPQKITLAGNEITCLLSSPDHKDFQISRAQLLANEENKLERAHENLIKQTGVKLKSKSQTLDKKNRLKSKQQSNPEQLRASKNDEIINSLEKRAVYEDKNPLYKNPLAKSDHEIERAMISKLGRLEQSASYFNHLCIKLSKELKKHRNKMIKDRMKRNETNQVEKERRRFLNDIHEDALFHQESLNSSVKLPFSMVQRAVNKTYAFRRKCQPTLTQMLNSDDEDGSCQEPAQENHPIADNAATESDHLMTEDEDVKYEKPLYYNDLQDVQDGEDFSEHTEKQVNDEHSNVDLGTLVDYEIASSKGKARGLWGLSATSPNSFSAMTQLFGREREHDWLNRDWKDGNNEIGDLVDMFMQELENSDVREVRDHDPQQQHPRSDDTTTSSSPSHELKHSTLSQLSPKQQDACRSITAEILTNEDKANSIKKLCPTWEENVTFAFQQDPEEVKVALDKVQEMRSKLDKVQEMFLQHVKSRDIVLQLYESALSKSLSMQTGHNP